MYANVLIPTDGSELAAKAVQHGIALAKRIGAKVTVLTVLPPFHTFSTDTSDDRGHAGSVQSAPAARRRGNSRDRRTRSAGGGRRVRDRSKFEHEHPYRAIIDTADIKRL